MKGARSELDKAVLARRSRLELYSCCIRKSIRCIPVRRPKLSNQQLIMIRYQNTIQKPTFLGPNIAQIISKVGQSGQDASTFFDQVKQKEGDQKFKVIPHCHDNNSTIIRRT